MLFDVLNSSQLVGIAKLASASPLLESKKRTQYLELETRSYIGRASGDRFGHVWTVNPYRGCEYGCKYCYARYAHEFMELRDPLEFERKIFAKRFRAADFRRELRKVKANESLWIGTATDPYQPAERRFRITRRMLEVLRSQRGLRIGITTKSDLPRRDADLLEELARENTVHLNFTVTTLDAALARALEPLAPRPELRLEAASALSRVGVRVRVQAAPVLPLINDSPDSLEAVCRAAREAGALSFSAMPLFLKPCAQAVFFPFLEASYPHLVRKYRERYAESAYLKGHYPEQLQERVRDLNARYFAGVDHHPEQPQPQLDLFRTLE